MKTLYIIGNGFDLYHKLDTSYRSFGLFLKKKYTNIYDQLIEYYGLSDLDECVKISNNDILWNEFEKSLSLLDPEIVFEDHRDSLANPGSADFRDRDWGAFAIDMKMVVDSLTTQLFKAFKEFILEVKYPTLNADLQLHIDESAYYLTFNYTNTLEQYYGIPDGNINYIHGRAETGEGDLILGHGIEPDNFKEEVPKPPEGLSPEKLELWMDQMGDNYDFSFELGQQELLNYFSRTFKQTKDIIASNADFYNKIFGVENIYVLGHSLSEIDMLYFEEIIDSVKTNPVFTVSYYSEEERLSHKEKLLNLGIKENHIILIKLDELVTTNDGKF